jgi:lipopolysaccharide biosynthesis glycosyltransferase
MEKSRPYHTFLYITVIYLYPSLRPRMRGHYFRAKPVSKNGSVCIIFRMEDKIKIFIGTCVRNLQAEIALEYSLRRNTNSDIEIVWMRDIPSNKVFHGWNRDNWGTGFTPFRWVVPELCGFKGKAIYMDVDMICLGDIRELWEMSIPDGKVMKSLPGNYSVMLFDCEHFGKMVNTSPIARWRQSSCSPAFNGLYNDYVTQLESNDLVASLEVEWNSLDRLDYTQHPFRWQRPAKLIHYTQKDTQPWCPYPEKHQYKRHTRPECETLWYQIYEEAVRVSLDEGTI